MQQHPDRPENHMTATENPMTATITQIPETQDVASPVLAFRETTVLIVDDHPAVQLGLRLLIEDEPDFELSAVTSSSESAMSIAEREPVDVVVADYHLRSRNGLWLCGQLKRLPDPPRVLIYSAYADGLLAAGCVAAEADGLVSKGGVGSWTDWRDRSENEGSLNDSMSPTRAAALSREPRADARDERQICAGAQSAAVSVPPG
jgi:CheY-like chemotaxis protein